MQNTKEYSIREISEMFQLPFSTICCFKNAGMKITELQKFFAYESNEMEHLGDILLLLKDREKEICEQMQQLEKDHAHILRKLHYYSDIKQCAENKLPLPQWAEYKDKIFEKSGNIEYLYEVN